MNFFIVHFILLDSKIGAKKIEFFERNDVNKWRERDILNNLLMSLMVSTLNAICCNSVSINSLMNSFGVVLSLGSEGRIVGK